MNKEIKYITKHYRRERKNKIVRNKVKKYGKRIGRTRETTKSFSSFRESTIILKNYPKSADLKRMKNRIIIPRDKKGNKKAINDYSVILPLQRTSNLLIRIITIRITQKNEISNKYKHFKSNRWTVDAIFFIMQIVDNDSMNMNTPYSKIIQLTW